MTYTVEIQERILRFDDVSLKIEDLPAKMHASFDQTGVGPNQTKTKLTISTDVDVPVGKYEFTVVATEAGGQEEGMKCLSRLSRRAAGEDGE